MPQATKKRQNTYGRPLSLERLQSLLRQVIARELARQIEHNYLSSDAIQIRQRQLLDRLRKGDDLGDEVLQGLVVPPRLGGGGEAQKRMWRAYQGMEAIRKRGLEGHARPGYATAKGLRLKNFRDTGSPFRGSAESLLKLARQDEVVRQRQAARAMRDFLARRQGIVDQMGYVPLEAIFSGAATQPLPQATSKVVAESRDGRMLLNGIFGPNVNLMAPAGPVY